MRALPLGGAVPAAPSRRIRGREKSPVPFKRNPGQEQSFVSKRGQEKPCLVKNQLKASRPAPLRLSAFLPCKRAYDSPSGQQLRRLRRNLYATKNEVPASSSDEIRHARSSPAGARPVGCRRAAAPPHAPPPSHNPPRSAAKMVLLLRAASCPRRVLLAIALLRPPAAAACAHGWFAGSGRRRGPGSGTVRGAGPGGREGRGREGRKALGAEDAAPELPSGVGSCCPVHRVLLSCAPRPLAGRAFEIGVCERRLVALFPRELRGAVRLRLLGLRYLAAPRGPGCTSSSCEPCVGAARRGTSCCADLTLGLA